MDGIAVDNAGNQASTSVLINIDTQAPTLTGSPADGEVYAQTKPPLVIEYTDELSGVDPSSLQVILDGTNDVTANFQKFDNGAYWQPTNDLTLGQHTWEIAALDFADNPNWSEAIFTITTNNTFILSGVVLSGVGS